MDKHSAFREKPGESLLLHTGAVCAIACVWVQGLAAGQKILCPDLDPFSLFIAIHSTYYLDFLGPKNEGRGLYLMYKKSGFFLCVKKRYVCEQHVSRKAWLLCVHHLYVQMASLMSRKTCSNLACQALQLSGCQEQVAMLCFWLLLPRLLSTHCAWQPLRRTPRPHATVGVMLQIKEAHRFYLRMHKIRTEFCLLSQSLIDLAELMRKIEENIY